MAIYLFAAPSKLMECVIVMFLGLFQREVTLVYECVLSLRISKHWPRSVA